MSTDYDCWHEEEEPVNVGDDTEHHEEKFRQCNKAFLNVIPKLKAYNDVCVR